MLKNSEHYFVEMIMEETCVNMCRPVFLEPMLLCLTSLKLCSVSVTLYETLLSDWLIKIESFAEIVQ